MATLAITPSLQAQLKRSPRRRSIGIKVCRGEVVVSAPSQVPLRDIQSFVLQKNPWIQRHLHRQQSELALRQDKLYRKGDSLLYLGEPMVLGPENALLRGSDSLSLDARKNLVAKWYIDKATEYLDEKVKMYSAIMGVQPQGIKIRYYKSRWGSCNRRGQLQFNWAIIMAPAEVVDYVVVHELAHLKHFNHSPAFWRVVESVMPNHKQHRAWLKNQTQLEW